ncbi:MAG TPA: hypothetical protein VGH80_07745 [Xanthomonadaceae bacterium]|jgi:hypothetical protein
MPRVSIKSADAILAALSAPAEPIDGGPVDAARSALATLWLIPWCCDPGIQVALFARTPGEDAFRPIFTVQGIEDAPGWLVAEFGKAVARLSPGTEVELAAANIGWVKRDSRASVDARLVAGNQRYRGRVVDGARMELTHAWPRLPAGTLHRAIALFEQVADTNDDWAESEAEAAEAIALGRQSFYFCGNKFRAATEPVGRSIAVDGRWRAFVALLFFRLRFAAGPWDVQAWRDIDEDNKRKFDAWQKQFHDALAQERERKRPKLLDVVHSSGRGDYGRTDVPVLPWVDDHMLYSCFSQRNDPRMPSDGSRTLTLAEAVDIIDRDMAAIDHPVIDNLAGEILDSFALRCYSDGRRLATLNISVRDGVFEYSFYSRMADGGWIVTTTRRETAFLKVPALTAALRSIDARGAEPSSSSAIPGAMVSIHAANLAVGPLHALHLARAGAATAARTAPSPGSLEQAAQWIDAFLETCASAAQTGSIAFEG